MKEGDWNDLILAVVFQLTLPLLPLLFELWITNDISAQSCTIAASMFSFSIGLATRYRAVFGISVVVGLIFAMAYGAAMIKPGTPESAVKYSLITIGFFALAHFTERIKIHVVQKERFWLFE